MRNRLITHSGMRTGACAAVLCALVSAVIGGCANEGLGGCDAVRAADVAIWNENPRIQANRGEEQLTARQSQENSSCLFLTGATECWLLDLEVQRVWFPSCGVVYKIESRLSAGGGSEPESLEDPGFDDALPGYGWYDVQLDRKAIYRALFDTPDFDDDVVVFWDYDHKVVVNLQRQ